MAGTGRGGMARPGENRRFPDCPGGADPLARGLTVTRERTLAVAGAETGAATTDAVPDATTTGAAGGGPVSYFELDFPS